MNSASQKLDPSAYRLLVRQALAEDIGAGDITTNAIIGDSARARGVFVAKSALTLAGVDLALEAFAQRDANVSTTLNYNDGDECAPGALIGEIAGSARALLGGERTALNFLQHLSGVATLTRAFVRASGGRITILDTRKTTPMFRTLEKYAVRMGGGRNYRMSLNDGVLIKDNHIQLANGVASAIARVRASGTTLPIEVEVTTLGEAAEALEAHADILLLDNMTIELIGEAVQLCKGRAKTEISGGVTLDRIPVLAATGADFVSSGALTHSAPAVDISFEIEPA
jgi:nicotinate-nucleotide pyrophosphorylase (carboxylating)